MMITITEMQLLCNTENLLRISGSFYFLGNVTRPNNLRKEKEVDLYSAYRQYNSTTRPKRSDVDHTELAYLQIHHICK